jgi:hypothetical protein
MTQLLPHFPGGFHVPSRMDGAVFLARTVLASEWTCPTAVLAANWVPAPHLEAVA